MWNQFCSHQDEYDQISDDIIKVQNDILERRVRRPFVSGMTTNGLNYIDTRPIDNNNDTILSQHTFLPSEHSDKALQSPLPPHQLVNIDPSNPSHVQLLSDTIQSGHQQATVVLCHGYSQGLGAWTENIDQISQIPGVNRVVAFDWAGMGGSKRTQTIPLRSPLSYFERYRHHDLLDEQLSTAAAEEHKKKCHKTRACFTKYFGLKGGSEGQEAKGRNNDQGSQQAANEFATLTTSPLPEETFQDVIQTVLNPLMKYSSAETREKFNNAIVTPASQLATLLYNIDGKLSLDNYIDTGIKNSFSPLEAVDFFIDPLIPMWKELGLDEQQVIVVGHSLGGLLASHFCQKYPGLVHGLVLASPVGVSQGLGLASEYENEKKGGLLKAPEMISDRSSETSILQNTSPDMVEALLSASAAMEADVEQEAERQLGLNKMKDEFESRLIQDNEKKILKWKNEKAEVLQNEAHQVQGTEEVITTITDRDGSVTTTRSTKTTYRPNERVAELDKMIQTAQKDIDSVQGQESAKNNDDLYIHVPNFGLRLFHSLWKVNLLQPQTILRLLPDSWSRKVSTGMTMRMHGDGMDEGDQKILSEYIHKLLTAPPSGEYAMNSILTIDYPKREFITPTELKRYSAALQSEKTRSLEKFAAIQRSSNNKKRDGLDDVDHDFFDGVKLDPKDREFLEFVRYTSDFRSRLSMERSAALKKLEEQQALNQNKDNSTPTETEHPSESQPQNTNGDSQWARRHTNEELSNIDKDIRTPSVFARAPLSLSRVLPQLNIPVTFLYGDDDWLYQGDVPYIVRNLRDQCQTTDANKNSKGSNSSEPPLNPTLKKITLPAVLGQKVETENNELKQLLLTIKDDENDNCITNPNSLIHQPQQQQQQQFSSSRTYTNTNDKSELSVEVKTKFAELAKSHHLALQSIVPVPPSLDDDGVVEVDSEYERKKALAMLNFNPDVSLSIVDNAGHHLYSNNSANFNHNVGVFIKSQTVDHMKRNKEEFGVEYDPKYSKSLLNKYYNRHCVTKLKAEKAENEKRTKELSQNHGSFNNAVTSLFSPESARVVFDASREILFHGVVDNIAGLFGFGKREQQQEPPITQQQQFSQHQSPPQQSFQHDLIAQYKPKQ